MKLHIQSAKKCEMTSFSMTSLHVDLNEAAKCVEIIPPTLLASFSSLPTLVQNNKIARTIGLTKINRQICESSSHENLERTHGWCSAVGIVAF